MKTDKLEVKEEVKPLTNEEEGILARYADRTVPILFYDGDIFIIISRQKLGNPSTEWQKPKKLTEKLWSYGCYSNRLISKLGWNGSMITESDLKLLYSFSSYRNGEVHNKTTCRYFLLE